MVPSPRRLAPLLRCLPAAVLVWGAMASAHAQAPTRPARLGLCAACHGETGMAQIPAAPNLAGQKLDYLREALRQYRDGRRNAPLMRAAIGPVSDADLDELARWYSAQTPKQGNP